MTAPGFSNPGADVSATPADAQTRTSRKRKPKGNRTPKAARKAVVADATARVWELRRKGLTFREIEAETTKQGDPISRSSAASLFRDELKRVADETRADVEAYRAEAIAKAEAAQIHLLPKMRKGDSRASTAYARHQDQINKIRGVYAPIKVDVKDDRFRALTDDALHAELQRGAAALGYTLVPAG